MIEMSLLIHNTDQGILCLMTVKKENNNTDINISEIICLKICFTSISNENLSSFCSVLVPNFDLYQSFLFLCIYVVAP